MQSFNHFLWDYLALPGVQVLNGTAPNCPAPNKYIETLSTNQKVDSNVVTAESGQAALSRIFSLSILTARKESPIVSEISERLGRSVANFFNPTFTIFYEWFVHKLTICDDIHDTYIWVQECYISLLRKLHSWKLVDDTENRMMRC